MASSRFTVLLGGPSAPLESAAGTRLHFYIRLNVLTVLIGIAWLVLLRIWLLRSDWIDVIVLLLVVLGGCLARADRLVTADRYAAAVVLVAWANWSVSVLVVVIVPFALVVLPLFALLPALLAVPYLDRERLTALLGGTVGVTLTIAAVGRLVPGVGLEELVDEWVLIGITLTFIPIGAALACVLASQSHLVVAAKAAAARESAARLVAATDRERRRIERDLHDGTQQRLVAVAMQLRVAQRLQHTNPDRADELLDNLARDVQHASVELRDLSHGIYPPQLIEQGLAAALQTAALHIPRPITLRCEHLGRYPPQIESAVYFSCLEGLHNTVKHAGPGAAITITLHEDNGLTFDLTDTGTGCDPAALGTGHGLRNIRDRIDAIGGTLTIHTQPGHGVHLHGHIPPAAAEHARIQARPSLGAALRVGFTTLWAIARNAFGRIEIGTTDQERVTTAFLLPLRVVVFGSVPFLLAAYARSGSGWVLTLGVLTLGAVAGHLLAVKAARSGHTKAALIVFTLTLWVFIPLATAMVPVLLTQLSLLLALPVILAVPHARSRFLPINIITVVMSLLVAMIGCFSPGVGLQEQAPDWLIDLDVIYFVTINMIICLFVDQLNHDGLTTKSAALRASQARLVTATDRERRRIERDLHDGAQQRLVAVAMQLRVAQRLQHTDPDRAEELVDRLTRDVQQASTELRDLSRGIYPPQLKGQGLLAALQSAALHIPRPITLRCEHLGRYPPQIESAVYFSCLEGLQNSVKHAGPGAAITVTLHGVDGLTFDLRDSGAGCDPSVLRTGHGLRNIRDRIDAIGGTLTIHAQPGHGVHLHGHIPRPEARQSAP